eukprot:scaffold10200_cov284-Chaetoceros_neogracile.AAC.15
MNLPTRLRRGSLSHITRMPRKISLTHEEDRILVVEDATRLGGTVKRKRKCGNASDVTNSNYQEACHSQHAGRRTYLCNRAFQDKSEDGEVVL